MLCKRPNVEPVVSCTTSTCYQDLKLGGAFHAGVEILGTEWVCRLAEERRTPQKRTYKMLIIHKLPFKTVGKL
eukprot:5742032-Amphidinium_carterae.1